MSRGVFSNQNRGESVQVDMGTIEAPSIIHSRLDFPNFVWFCSRRHMEAVTWLELGYNRRSAHPLCSQLEKVVKKSSAWGM